MCVLAGLEGPGLGGSHGDGTHSGQSASSAGKKSDFFLDMSFFVQAEILCEIFIKISCDVCSCRA